MSLERSLQSLSDDELLRRLADVLRQSRRLEADLVAHILEVDARKLWAREACPSMYAYCVEVLHLSEAEAFLRIAVARASRDYPLIMEMLADGRLHLSGIARLAPHLTPENAPALLSRAVHLSKRRIEELVAEIAPRADVVASVRRLPRKKVPPPPPELPRALDLPAGGTEPSLRPDRVSPPTVQPLAPERYKVQFTASAAFQQKLERLQALLPDNDLARILEEAVTEKLERLEARRFARTKSPRTTHWDAIEASRYLPAGLRRAVFMRDAGRCRFKDASGRRCAERHRLEYHHRIPFGMGGGPTLRNVCLMCRAHNQYLADGDYGKASMDRHRHPAGFLMGSRLRPDGVPGAQVGHE